MVITLEVYQAGNKHQRTGSVNSRRQGGNEIGVIHSSLSALLVLLTVRYLSQNDLVQDGLAKNDLVKNHDAPYYISLNVKTNWDGIDSFLVYYKLLNPMYTSALTL